MIYRLDLWRGTLPDGLRNTAAAGLAFVGGACGSNAVSINEFPDTTVLAHELGHK